MFLAKERKIGITWFIVLAISLGIFFLFGIMLFKEGELVLINYTYKIMTIGIWKKANYQCSNA